jgi:Uma2 family endonuclease
MSIPAHDLCMTIEEYLQMEQSAHARHEYVAGRVFSMVGASVAHNIIVSNLNHLLYGVVRESGCWVFSSDMKLWIEAAQSFYYPDLLVTCESLDQKSAYVKAPCLVAEVLSPSTSDVDRREKLTAYRHLSSLREYVLIYQDKKQIELYRKDETGTWHCTVFSGEESTTLSALPGGDLEISMQQIYSGVELPLY